MKFDKNMKHFLNQIKKRLCKFSQNIIPAQETCLLF